jgi:hypothetical protein
MIKSIVIIHLDFWKWTFNLSQFAFQILFFIIFWAYKVIVVVIYYDLVGETEMWICMQVHNRQWKCKIGENA